MMLKKYKLHEVATFELSNVDKKSKDGEQSVRLCNFTDVYYNWAVTRNMERSFMLATASESQIKKLAIQKGQVAITKDSETRHDIGIPTYIADDLENTVLGYHCALITPDQSKVDGRFLNAFLNSKMAKEYFANNASGSGMRYSLPVDAIKNILLYLPELEVQKRIGHLLSIIDRKIALNREINRNLEAMARQLYDYWFVQFDFPDENGKPYKSSGGKMVWNEKLKREIPTDWGVCSLGDYVIANNTGDWGYASESDGKTLRVGCIRGADIVKLNDLPIRYLNNGNHSKLLNNWNIVIEVSGGSPVQATGRSAYITPGVIERNGGKITCSNFCHAFTIRNQCDSAFFYYSWQSLYDNGNMFNFEGKTSGIKNFMAETFLTIKWPDIPQKVSTQFFAVIESIHAKIDSNITENNSLTALRDELLPLLINGQVSIRPTSVNCDLSLG